MLQRERSLIAPRYRSSSFWMELKRKVQVVTDVPGLPVKHIPKVSQGTGEATRIKIGTGLNQTEKLIGALVQAGESILRQSVEQPVNRENQSFAPSGINRGTNRRACKTYFDFREVLQNDFFL